jgi:hypothetical protein
LPTKQKDFGRPGQLLEKMGDEISAIEIFWKPDTVLENGSNIHPHTVVHDSDIAVAKPRPHFLTLGCKVGVCKDECQLFLGLQMRLKQRTKLYCTDGQDRVARQW